MRQHSQDTETNCNIDYSVQNSTIAKSGEEAESCDLVAENHDAGIKCALSEECASAAQYESCSSNITWEEYWRKFGEQLVWNGWVEKYGEYMDDITQAAVPPCVSTEEVVTSECNNITGTFTADADLALLSTTENPCKLLCCCYPT